MLSIAMHRVVFVYRTVKVYSAGTVIVLNVSHISQKFVSFYKFISKVLKINVSMFPWFGVFSLYF